MASRFTDVPTDIDTTIIEQREVTIQGIEALHQHWRWDGVRAESLIFLTKEIAHLSPEALKDLLRKEELLRLDQSMTTSTTSNGYTFINFNFHA